LIEEISEAAGLSSWNIKGKRKSEHGRLERLDIRL